MACAGQDVEVEAVADGDRAIARIAEHPPDIVLAGVAMPGRNGYEVAAFVKGRADLAHIPVLLLVGMFEAADEARARDLGCAEVLVKPLKPHHVRDRVRHWLEAVPAPSRDGQELGDRGPVRDAATAAQSAEDYFSRLDAAFKTLERPLGERLADGASSASRGDQAAGGVAPVPTLQELLGRLPEETRTRLTPPAPSTDELPPAADSPVFDAIATRVLEHLSRRDDLLDEIARRVARLTPPAGGR